MKTIKLKCNPSPNVPCDISDQKLIQHLAYEFPELPHSLTVLLQRFDERVCGIRQRTDMISRNYLATGPH